MCLHTYDFEDLKVCDFTIPGLSSNASPHQKVVETSLEIGDRRTVIANHGSLNVPIEHHPTIRYMVYNGYYKVMSNIPKMGHLPTPANH